VEKAAWVAEHLGAEVPHRQFVFTIPKRLRLYFRFDRRLLGDLCRVAASTPSHRGGADGTLTRKHPVAAGSHLA
jgi:hypothetical protein